MIDSLSVDFGQALASVIWKTMEFCKTLNRGKKNPIDFPHDLKAENLKIFGIVSGPYVARIVVFARLPIPNSKQVRKRGLTPETFEERCFSLVLNSLRLKLTLGMDPTAQTIKAAAEIWDDIKTLWNKLWASEMRGGKLKLHIPVHYPMKIADPKVGTGRPTSVNEAAGEKKHQNTKHYVRTKQTTACNKQSN